MHAEFRVPSELGVRSRIANNIAVFTETLGAQSRFTAGFLLFEQRQSNKYTFSETIVPTSYLSRTCGESYGPHRGKQVHSIRPLAVVRIETRTGYQERSTGSPGFTPFPDYCVEVALEANGRPKRKVPLDWAALKVPHVRKNMIRDFSESIESFHRLDLNGRCPVMCACMTEAVHKHLPKQKIKANKPWIQEDS